MCELLGAENLKEISELSFQAAKEAKSINAGVIEW
jgi:hypothetical protein